MIHVNSPEEFLALVDDDYNESGNRSRFCQADEETWMEIINSHPDFAKSVAWNKMLPNSILEILSKDVDSSVRWEVAIKRKTPVHILENLSRDEDSSVRQRVACNASTPKYILEKLCFDEDENVSTAACDRINAQ